MQFVAVLDAQSFSRHLIRAQTRSRVWIVLAQSEQLLRLPCEEFVLYMLSRILRTFIVPIFPVGTAIAVPLVEMVQHDEQTWVRVKRHPRHD